jgi:hypothetical protein
MDQEPSIQRRLAAILAADIAGYSRLMHEDEPAAVRDLKAHQSVSSKRTKFRMLSNWGPPKRLKVQVKIKRKENSYEIHDVDDPGRLSRQ